MLVSTIKPSTHSISGLKLKAGKYFPAHVDNKKIQTHL